MPVLEEELNEDCRSVTKYYLLEDVGDLSNYFGYEDYDTTDCLLEISQEIDEPATFEIKDGNGCLKLKKERYKLIS